MIEGIERTDKRCAIAVQFHPEAAVVKHIGKAVNNDNADQFMSYDAGMKIFSSFLNAIHEAFRAKRFSRQLIS